MHVQPTRTGSRVVPRPIRERRWWLLALVAWLTASGVYLHWQSRQIREQTLQVALEGARNMFRMVVLTRDWNASHGGIYVPVTARTPPNPHLEHPRRDLTTTDGQQLTMINPAYMTRLIAEMAESEAGAIFRLTSLKPMRPENAPDAWEKQALEAFEAGRREVHGVERGESGDLLRYMAPLPVKASCLACHAKQGYQVGDIRGGISVSQAYGPIAGAMQAQIGDLRLATGLIVLLVAGLGWLMLEQLRRRWLELADNMQTLEETQQQLLQSEKLAAIGQLAAGVAHEINNPISFINSNLGTLNQYATQLTGLLDACRKGQASPDDFAATDYDYLRDDIAALIGESRTGLERVRKIVADLKDFAHIDQADLEAADLNRCAESTLNVLGHTLAGRATIIRDYAPLPPVRCIVAQINQVLLNLLQNASRALGEHGTITVRSGHDARWVWIEVADNGCGMPAKVLEHIFEPFFTTRAVGQGSGLGLSMAYDIVQKHGGQIDVRSTPGEGSCFRISLPRAAAD